MKTVYPPAADGSLSRADRSGAAAGDINVNFDGFQALTDLSLQIGVGELRCVIGPNGAGKTTLMDVITGKTRPQSGRALYDQSVDLTTSIPSPSPARASGASFRNRRSLRR
jgi:urea transport system ATP-binding protein